MLMNSPDEASVALSIVVPALNEEENVPELYARIVKAMEDLDENSYEIVFVDDGSTDGTFGVMEDLAGADQRVRVVRFRTNMGKSAGYSVGFSVAQGAVVITMDADLQDDPLEIGKFLEKLAEGYDSVTGWKYRGKGSIGRALPSRIFNRVVSLATGLGLHDINCPFKAYRREILKDLNLYGELYRFIPALLHNRGYKIAEIRVENLPRKYGKSKFGFERFMRGYLDLITVLFITRYDQSPLYLFGYAGTLLFAAGFLLDAFLTIRGVFFTGEIAHTAALLLGILLMLLGVQMFATGLVSDLVVSRERRDQDFYPIQEMLGITDADTRV
jgi:glycosyltransferase involved in cell wall biosynthesis